MNNDLLLMLWRALYLYKAESDNGLFTMACYVSHNTWGTGRHPAVSIPQTLLVYDLTVVIQNLGNSVGNPCHTSSVMLTQHFTINVILTKFEQLGCKKMSRKVTQARSTTDLRPCICDIYPHLCLNVSTRIYRFIKALLKKIKTSRKIMKIIFTLFS